jgi:hypothetical protein
MVARSRGTNAAHQSYEAHRCRQRWLARWLPSSHDLGLCEKTVTIHNVDMLNKDLRVESSENAYVPVTFDRCDHVAGPFLHGTKVAFDVGDEIEPGHLSNFHEGRVSNHVYFTALLEPAVWGAELAVALTGSETRGRIYLVEPTGPFEDDPNVTNKKFPGNVTQSYRTRHALRVVGEVHDWEGHATEVLQGMLDNIAWLREKGLDVIED